MDQRAGVLMSLWIGNGVLDAAVSDAASDARPQLALAVQRIGGGRLLSALGWPAGPGSRRDGRFRLRPLAEAFARDVERTVCE